MITFDTAATNAKSDIFVPPPYEQPHIWRQFEEIVQQVANTIMPVWPLMDYVAVNPYAGVSERPFMDARAFLKAFSDCELLMPLRHYAERFNRGEFNVVDLEAASEELRAVGVSANMSTTEIVEKLRAMGDNETTRDDNVVAANGDRHIRTIAEYASSPTGIDWSEAVRDEISKHCAAHYDQGQAVWSSPWKDLPLYQAWRMQAQHDRDIELLGLTGMRKFAASLPHTPEAAIVFSLQSLGIPKPLWEAFLLCQAFSIPGWSAWAKYQQESREHMDCGDFTGLLAIRLAYDVAISQAFSISVNFNSLVKNESLSFRTPMAMLGDDSALRLILLRATEIALRTELLESLSIDTRSLEQGEVESVIEADRKSAQMVFCIDVRSERIRRHLESQSSKIETFGFAGFFGMPIEFVPLGETTGNANVPVLLKPRFRLREGVRPGDAIDESAVLGDRQQIRIWRKLWKSLQSSAVGCFSFVETTGSLYGLKLLGHALGVPMETNNGRFDGLSKGSHDRLAPTLRTLNHQGITTSHQTDLAENMLKNLGLTENFARLVVFCGHAGQTENNPLRAGLDCGACGGHSGEPNARFAAILLNQTYIRSALKDRGIEIPADTHFLGGLHNTTTDELTYFDLQDVPASHTDDVKELILHSKSASDHTRCERMPIVDSATFGELAKRAVDWSEVRPEWGLAGNAAFVAAPRDLTIHGNLDGRVFLHSYDHRRDPDGTVLETIMTAPMIVAQWINMQYYASTVDNRHFGSGSKTIHNVVGRFGILSGNGGDLTTGLPWQSLHNGTEFQHLPMRLQALIVAPRTMIQRVIEKHEVITNQLVGGWLHLIALDDGIAYSYAQDGSWKMLDSVSSCASTC